MARTSFEANDPLAVSLWSKKTEQETLKATAIFNFMGRSDQSAIQILDDASAKSGQNITWALVMQLLGDGTIGNNTLEGNEEEIQRFDDTVVINELRHATQIERTMREQRIVANIDREKARFLLQDWYAGRIDQWYFNHVCGFTPETRLAYTGHNAVTAADSGHIIRQTSRVSDETLVAGDEFTLQLLIKAVESAETLTPPMRPIMINGKKHWLCFIHDFQEADLKLDAGTTGGWQEIQQAAITGGQITGNPLFTGALGMYNGVVLHKANRVTEGVRTDTGVAQTDVRRAVFAGKQSAVIAFGKRNGPSRYMWEEETFDYSKWLGVSIGTVAGLKASIFDSKFYGNIVLPTYAVAHA